MPTVICQNSTWDVHDTVVDGHHGAHRFDCGGRTARHGIPGDVEAAHYQARERMDDRRYDGGNYA